MNKTVDDRKTMQRKFSGLRNLNYVSITVHTMAKSGHCPMKKHKMSFDEDLLYLTLMMMSSDDKQSTKC